MTAPRSRKEHQEYEQYINERGPDASCQFCEIDKGNEQFVKKTAHFKVIRNIFSYSIWDSQKVVDHLLVVPVQHTDTLKDLTAEGSKEFVDLISDYEQDGYNIYARAPASNMKSVVHQHTHLIKLAGKRMGVVFHLRRPYIRIAK